MRKKWLLLSALFTTVVFLTPDDGMGQQPPGFPGGGGGFPGGGGGFPGGGGGFPGGGRGGPGGGGGFPGGGGGFPGGGGGFPGGGGGGPGGGRGMGMDPDAMWARMTNGAGDSVDLNQNTALRDRLTRMGTPVPPDGILRKDAFKAAMAQRMGMPAPTPTPAPGGPAMVVSITPGGAQPPGAPAWGGPGGPGGGRGGPGGGRGGPGGGWGGPGGGGPGGPGGWGGPGGDNGGGNGGEDAETSFRSLAGGADTINKDQAQKSRHGLGQSFDKYDTNKDGAISLDEYRVFFAAVTKRNDPNAPLEDERPTVFRYGKLPPEFQSAYGKLDTDKDGQIGLYEWRAGGMDVEKFIQMDLNGDGFLTADEYLRYIKLVSEPKPGEPGTNGPSMGNGPRGAGGNRGGGGPGGRGNGGGGDPGSGAPQGKGGGRGGKGGNGGNRGGNNRFAE